MLEAHMLDNNASYFNVNFYRKYYQISKIKVINIYCISIYYETTH